MLIVDQSPLPHCTSFRNKKTWNKKSVQSLLKFCLKIFTVSHIYVC